MWMSAPIFERFFGHLLGMVEGMDNCSSSQRSSWMLKCRKVITLACWNWTKDCSVYTKSHRCVVLHILEFIISIVRACLCLKVNMTDVPWDWLMMKKSTTRADRAWIVLHQPDEGHITHVYSEIHLQFVECIECIKKNVEKIYWHYI